MGATFRLGRIRGVAVDVSWTVLVIVGLVAWSLASQTLPEWAPGHLTSVCWSAAGLAALALMASILAHEVSHAVVANRNGVPVEGITLWMFGGLARLGRQARDASVELRIALAGPAMSVAIGLGCLLLAGLSGALGGSDLLTTTIAWLGAINLVLAVFNLLPGAPLDRGRVLTAILWRRSGDGEVPRAAWATTTLGSVAVPADELAVARAEEPLIDALGRAGASDGRILVVDGRQLVGIVTPSDVTAALERGALARSSGGGS